MVTPHCAFFRHIQTSYPSPPTTSFFSPCFWKELVMLIKRQKKSTTDENGNIHALSSSFLPLTPCRTIASSSSPKSKADP